MEQYLELLISEFKEYIKHLNEQLLVLETDARAMPAILDVFRIFHTIKGMSQTMGYASIADIAHTIEELLNDAKKHGEINPQVVDFLFTVADFFARTLDAIEHKKSLPSTRRIMSAISTVRSGKRVRLLPAKRMGEEMADIRVKMHKLDTLFNLTNELMITRARLVKLSKDRGDEELLRSTEIASQLLSTVKDEVMRLRMLPLSTVFDFFPRWFRDEAKRQHKQVDFVVMGGDIEVDRSIIDVLKEPLLHLIRNALDHGITQTGDRHRSTRGKVSLVAERKKERIRISICDNGTGIDTEYIKRVARERNIAVDTRSPGFTHSDLLRILTDPHFSTKGTVSPISGRGIGLNIVKSTTEKLGGRIELHTEMGTGTCFTLDLPLSLALVRAMIFNLDHQRFAIPLNYIQETFYAEESMVKTVYHRELFPLRNEMLPLIRLSDRLSCTRTGGRKSIIVVSYGDKRRGFITDEIIDEEEIVVKRLDPLVSNPLYSGCSVYADGLPILIIDPRGFT
jgi:two-component system chemotaxis sensor kinase CheA